MKQLYVFVTGMEDSNKRNKLRMASKQLKYE